MSRWPTPISVINDTVWKHLSLDIRTLLNSFRKQFQKQQITNNNQPFSHSFENGYLTKVSGVSLLAYGTLFTPKKGPTRIHQQGQGLRGRNLCESAICLAFRFLHSFKRATSFKYSFRSCLKLKSLLLQPRRYPLHLQW